MTQKKILVPTNFSCQAAHALAHAQKLARLHPAQILLLHVCDEFPVDLLREREGLTLEVLALQAEAAERELHAVVETIRQQGGSARALQVVGSTHAQILRVASYEKVDLIVMGTRATPDEVRPLGSLAERVARTSWLPVTLVRAPSFDADTRKLGILQPVHA